MFRPYPSWLASSAKGLMKIGPYAFAIAFLLKPVIGCGGPICSSVVHSRPPSSEMSGDGFTVSSGGLNRSVTVGAGQTVTAKVVMGFVTNEIPESLSEYNSYRGFSNDTAFATHVRAYNLWWAQNIPYFDSPELALK